MRDEPEEMGSEGEPVGSLPFLGLDLRDFCRQPYALCLL